MLKKISLISFAVLLSIVILVPVLEAHKSHSHSSGPQKWSLVSIKGKPVKSKAFLILEKRKLYGNSGCNRFSVQAGLKKLMRQKTGKRMIMSTRMHCGSAMKIEQAFMKSMQQATRFVYKGKKEGRRKLIFFGKNGRELIRFRQAR